MRKIIHAIFVISTLVVLVLCSACVFSPLGDQKPLQDSGLTQVAVPVETSRISFDEARQKLEEHKINETADVKTIYYIIAKNMDESGNAASWVFGINQGPGAKLLVYDKTGFTAFNWSTHIPEKISLDQIVYPDTLFARNKAIIVTTPSQTGSERRDLELQQGIYTLTIYSGSTNRILTFNATTGALITQT